MQGKRITRSRTHRVMGGVAGGLADYLNVDPLWVRIGFLLLSLFNGLGGILYIIMWFLIPNEDSPSSDPRSQIQENVYDVQGTLQSFLIWVKGLFKT